MVISILQLIWLPDDSSNSASQASQSDDWLIMISEEYTLVSTMCLQMDTAPSVCLGSLLKSKNLNEMAASVQSAIKTAEGMPVIDWDQVSGMAKCGGPMALNGEFGFEDGAAESDDDDMVEPPPVSTPPPQKSKKRPVDSESAGVATPPGAKAKPAAKVSKAAKLAPKVSLVSPQASSSAPATPPTSVPSSSLKGRLVMGAGLSKPRR